MLTTSSPHDIARTIIFTGRPLRVRKTAFIQEWEEKKQDKIKELTSKGVIPVGDDEIEHRPHLMGIVATEVKSIESAKTIVESMVQEAVESIHRSNGFVQQAKL